MAGGGQPSSLIAAILIEVRLLLSPRSSLDVVCDHTRGKVSLFNLAITFVFHF